MTTRLYNSINAAGQAIGERKDCGVIALSILADIPYHKAHALLEAQGRKPGRSTHWAWFEAALKEAGFKTTEKKWGFHRSTKTIEREKSLAGGKWFIWTRSHYAAMVDGTLHDWSTTKALRVIGALKVEKIV